MQFKCNTFEENATAIIVNPANALTEDDPLVYDTLAPQGTACAYGKTAANEFINTVFSEDINNPPSFYFKYYAPDSPSTKLPTYHDYGLKDTVYACSSIVNDYTSCGIYVVNSQNYYPPFYTSGCLGCMVLNEDILSGKQLADSLSLISNTIDRELAANDIVQAFLTRDDSSGYAEIKKFYDEWKSNEAYLVMASSFQYVNNKDTALHYLWNFDPGDDDEDQHQEILARMINFYFDTISPWEQLSPSDKEYFDAKAESDYVSEVYAQAMLASFEGYNYDRIPQHVTEDHLPRVLRMPIDDELLKNRFVVYPNPTDNMLHIKFDYETNATLFIYNLLGSLVIEKSTNGSDDELPLDNLESGTFVIKIVDHNGILGVKKFIVMK